LRLDDLQRIAKKTIEETALRAEISRVLGPTIITDGKIEEVVTAVNEHIDTLEQLGRAGRLDFQASVVSPFLGYADPEVRKFAARVVPEKYLGNLVNDRDSRVRAIVATRMPLEAARDMAKRFPKDDQLRSILRKRKLQEAGISKPKVQDEPFDLNGDKRLGKVLKTPKGPELSDAWYEQMAHKLMIDYDQNIEYCWEELACKRYASSMKATCGIEVDQAKLLKALKDMIEDKEDRALERNALKETLEWLDGQEELSDINECALPRIFEEADDVSELVGSSLSPEQYVERAKAVFCIRESQLPAAIRKYRLSEGNPCAVSVPVIGVLPHSFGFRAVDERALDTFVESWSKKQSLAGEPLVLTWSVDPCDANRISFGVKLQ